jgi:hypothetical protein
MPATVTIANSIMLTVIMTCFSMVYAAFSARISKQLW